MNFFVISSTSFGSVALTRMTYIHSTLSGLQRLSMDRPTRHVDPLTVGPGMPDLLSPLSQVHSHGDCCC